MDSFVLGNMIWNAGLVALAAFFIRKWMGQIEDTAKENRTLAAESIAELADDIQDIVKEMRISNGRTAKLEGRQDTIEKLCNERQAVKHHTFEAY